MYLFFLFTDVRSLPRIGCVRVGAWRAAVVEGRIAAAYMLSLTAGTATTTAAPPTMLPPPLLPPWLPEANELIPACGTDRAPSDRIDRTTKRACAEIERGGVRPAPAAATAAMAARRCGAYLTIHACSSTWSSESRACGSRTNSYCPDTICALSWYCSLGRDWEREHQWRRAFEMRSFASGEMYRSAG
jgi:hypothetical protein